MDEASGQQNFKMTGNQNDNSVFMVMFIPIQLDNSNDEVVWKNEKPNSTRLCRPIKFSFEKETTTTTTITYNYYQKEIKNLKSSKLENAFGLNCSICYIFQCTMIDGKVCNVLTEQASTRSCNICRVTPRKISNIDHVIKLKCMDEYYQFGMSTLHCRIRYMEYYIYHIIWSLRRAMHLDWTKV